MLRVGEAMGCDTRDWVRNRDRIFKLEPRFAFASVYFVAVVY